MNPGIIGSMRLANQKKPETRGANNSETWPFWFTQSGSRSTAGPVVTRDTALSLPAVWMAVSMISADVAKLRLNLFKETLTTNKAEIYTRNPAQYLVNKEANEEMTARQFWRQIMGDALIFNNGYAFIGRGGDGRPRELLPLLPDRTYPYRIHGGQLTYRTTIESGMYVIDPFDILHIRGMMLTNPHSQAVDFLYYAREAIGLALSAQDFESAFFRNGMRATGVLNIPDNMPKTAGDNLQKSFRAQYENRSAWFRALVLREGATFTSIADQSMKDSETHLLREDQVREIARLFKLPPSKLGLEDSVSYNSKADDNRQYYETTLSPWLDMIADECFKKLLLPGERESLQYEFKHDLTQLLRLDLNARYQAYAIGIQNKFLLPSEVREKEDLPHIPKLDDAILNPQPMLLGQPEDQDEEDEDAPEADPPDEKDDRAYGHNEERDKWLSENRERYTLEIMSRKIKENEDWIPLGLSGIQKAVKRYRLYQSKAMSLVST